MKAKSAHRVTARSSTFPLLENGDHMNQAEFHRRYEQYPEKIKAELIGGIVFMASPLRRLHANKHPELSVALCYYKGGTPGLEVLDNATLILGDRSEPQPDLGLRILPDWGGQSGTSESDYVLGAPELLAETAHSSMSIDLNSKKLEYRNAGVLEYLVLCVEIRKLYWFDFRSDRILVPNRGGIIKSKVFPGLWIQPEALFQGDTHRTIAVLQQGFASRAHAAFVRRLQVTHQKLSGS